MSKTCNTELFNRCFEMILHKPERWDQCSWGTTQKISDIPEPMKQKIVEGADAQCGTTACLAGHAMLLSGDWILKIHDVRTNANQQLTSFDAEFWSVQERMWVSDWEDKFGFYGDDLYVYEGARLLGIDHDVAEALFMKTSITNPAEYVQFVKDTLEQHDYVL